MIFDPSKGNFVTLSLITLPSLANLSLSFSPTFVKMSLSFHHFSYMRIFKPEPLTYLLKMLNN